MAHYLIDQYPARVVPIIQFGAEQPDLLPERRSRRFIANLESQDERIQRIFRKRFGRWYVHVPSLVDYLECEDSIVPGVLS